MHRQSSWLCLLSSSSLCSLFLFSCSSCPDSWSWAPVPPLVSLMERTGLWWTHKGKFDQFPPAGLQKGLGREFGREPSGRGWHSGEKEPGLLREIRRHSSPMAAFQSGNIMDHLLSPVLTTLSALFNFINTTISWDQLYNYLHFMDEKLRFRQIKYLADLKACLAPLPLCQESHIPAGMDARTGFFLVRSRMRIRRKREWLSPKDELIQMFKTVFFLEFCPSTLLLNGFSLIIWQCS